MVFSPSALWWISLWELSDGRDRLRGKLGLVLMGGSMLSKSLIQFSVDGWGCFPSLLFTWGQTMVEVMKIMVTSFKWSHNALLYSVPPTLHQATANPYLCWRLLDLHGQVWVRLLWVIAPFSWAGALGPVVAGTIRLTHIYWVFVMYRQHLRALFALTM